MRVRARLLVSQRKFNFMWRDETWLWFRRTQSGGWLLYCNWRSLIDQKNRLRSLTQFDRQPLWCSAHITDDDGNGADELLCSNSSSSQVITWNACHKWYYLSSEFTQNRWMVCMCLGAVVVVDAAVVDDLGCFIFAVEFSIWFFASPRFTFCQSLII